MILTAKNIVKSYTSDGVVVTPVLRGASVVVDKGEFVAIVGPSGAGKSTLLHVLASLDTFDSGDIKLHIDGNDYDYGAMTEPMYARLRQDHIGFVYQFHHLLPEFTARENVMMPSLIRGDGKKVTSERAAMLLERVGLYERAEHMPSELSGGEQQRVAIARAVMNAPAILFADEPTGNLDSTNAGHVRSLLQDLQAEYSLTCIVATHSSELWESASRVVRIVDGVCV
ncbi:MAG: ABC transporter ATP-binding protein [Ignavibacteria bacterium]|nr:ABC transporter ATP-binding protein [Ignavibacteria bacterium]